MTVSVVVPTHNPHPVRLARTLAGLRAQTLPASDWEGLLVDNASRPEVDTRALSILPPGQFRIVRENKLGLTAARRAGLQASRGEIVVFVDDDNVLAPTYLAEVVRLMRDHPSLAAAGGPSRPEFEIEPPVWMQEFFPLLALRDLGPTTRISGLRRAAGGSRGQYPDCAPIGAGLALRRVAADTWEASIANTSIPDRRGSELSSGGDNDIILCALRAGWDVGYFPSLALTHLIPNNRLNVAYLARLNRGIQQSWMQVLRLHEANPWAPLSRGGAAARKLKAWFTYRSWSSPAAYIRWQGACGHFDGRVPLPAKSLRRAQYQPTK